MIKLNLADRLDPEIALTLNMKERTYEELPNMYSELNSADSSQEITTIDPMDNIIIFTPEEDLHVRPNKDGSMAILTSKDINVSGATIVGQTAILDFFPMIKVSIPKGIKLQFEKPFQSSYHSEIYPSFGFENKCNTEDCIPNFSIYSDIRFTLHLNLTQLSRTFKSIYLQKNTEMVSMYFYPFYFVGNHIFPLLNRIYTLKNTELFRNVQEVL